MSRLVARAIFTLCVESAKGLVVDKISHDHLIKDSQ